MDNNLPLASSKTAFYSALARAANYPDAALSSSLVTGDFVKELGAVLVEDSEPVLDRIKIYQGSDPAALLLDLEKDYTWMFFASKPRVAYLFGSVYSEGKLYQESTFEIARLYHEAGLKLDESFRLPPDHVAVELECMAYLCFNEMEAIRAGNRENEEYARELQARLLSTYLAPLARNIGERIAGKAKTDFYRVVGRLLTIVGGDNNGT